MTVVDHLPALRGDHRDRPVAAVKVHPAGGDAALQQPHQPLFRVVAERAEGGRPVEPGAPQPLVRRSLEQLHGRRQAEAAVDARDAAQPLAYHDRRLLRIVFLVVRQAQADVATPAAGQRLRFVAEVAQDRVVAAGAALGPAHQLQEQVPLVLHHLRRHGLPVAVALDEVAAQRHVPGRYDQHADGGIAVPAGASRFLVVRLQRARRRQVRHAAHVRPVDAHTEGVGGHHRVELAGHECALHALAPAAVHAGVIGGRLPLDRIEALRLLLGGPAGGRVDDRRPGLPPRATQRLGQHGVDVPLAFPPGHHLDHPQRQVGTREAVDELRRVRRQAEPFDDLVAHHRRRRCGAGQHPRPRQKLHQLPDLEIVGAKVVAPRTDAVRLVDGHQWAVQASQHGTQSVGGQSLRGHVHQLAAAGGHRGEPSPHLVSGQGPRQVGGRHAAALQGGNLIVHEGDQRRHHHGRARHQRRRKLIGQALAAPGRRHQQQAPRIEQHPDRLALTGAEGGKPEVPQAGVQIHVMIRGQRHALALAMRYRW